uniref:Nucleolar GTP-binding protein 2 n=1 Tax=Rhodnius prolixus TaxID=13249 RepID=T1HPX1_RHOPR
MAKVQSAKKIPRKQGINKSCHSMNPDRSKDSLKGVARPRTKSTINRLKMYKHFKAKRDKTGKVIIPAPFQSWVSSGTMARVEPNRKWFDNSRVVSQNALQKFQAELGKSLKNPYDVVMKPTRLPVSLLNESGKQKRVHILDTEPFETIFGNKKLRKRPSLQAADENQLAETVKEVEKSYVEDSDFNKVKEVTGEKEMVLFVFAYLNYHRLFKNIFKLVKFQLLFLKNVLSSALPMHNHRFYISFFELFFKECSILRLPNSHSKNFYLQIWNELFKVIDSSDIVIMMLDARDPEGALINLLRQFSKLHSERKQISVGIVGYPNVGKSSLVNALRSKKVCKVAPIAGETKVWQYVTLMRRIYLIDCPGVIHASVSSTSETDTDKVLRGIVRVENVPSPEQYVPAVLERVKREHLIRTYNITKWEDTDDFIRQFGIKTGKLLKGGEPDVPNISRMILNDWQRGKLPFYCHPPELPGRTEKQEQQSQYVIEQD